VPLPDLTVDLTDVGRPTVEIGGPSWRNARPAEPTVTVVIPTLNEARNLPHVLARLPERIDEVVIVDGRSTDGTLDVARDLLPDCVIVLETRPGKGAALKAGFEAASGDIIVMLDADGSTDPAEIPAFVGMLEAGADLVKGSRFMQGGGTDDMELHRKVGNWAITRAVNLCFGGRYSDLCYGYNAFWRDTLPLMEIETDGFEVETLMGIRALRAGMEVAEVPSFECPRIYGTSNLRVIRDGLRILRTILRERFRPFRSRVAVPRPRPLSRPVRRAVVSMLRLMRR
jgi:glycosyltransferase involved in cell wall biosynthesis